MVYLLIYIIVMFMIYFTLEYIYYVMNNPLKFDEKTFFVDNGFFASCWIIVLLVLIVIAPFTLIHFLVKKFIGENN